MSRRAAVGIDVYRGDRLIKKFDTMCGASSYYYPENKLSYLCGMMRLSHKRGENYTDYKKGLTFVRNEKRGKMKRQQAYKVLNKKNGEKFNINTTTELSRFINTNAKFYKDLNYWGVYESDNFRVWRA